MDIETPPDTGSGTVAESVTPPGRKDKPETLRKRMLRRRTKLLRRAWQGRVNLCRPGCVWEGIADMVCTAPEDGRAICKAPALRGRPCTFERALYRETEQNLSERFSDSTAALLAGLHVSAARREAEGRDGLEVRLRLVRIQIDAELRFQKLALDQFRHELAEAKRPRTLAQILEELPEQEEHSDQED